MLLTAQRALGEEYGSFLTDATTQRQMMESPGAAIPFEARARVAEGVLFRELEGEALILGRDGETYFRLDQVGMRMWGVLGESPTIQAAFETLCLEYEVDQDQLRRDLEKFLGELVARKLIEINHAVDSLSAPRRTCG